MEDESNKLVINNEAGGENNHNVGESSDINLENGECSGIHQPSNGHSPSAKKKRRGNLPKEAVQILRGWLIEHKLHPYPTEEEKETLVKKTGLTMLQVCNWFINARRRVLKVIHLKHGIDHEQYILVRKGNRAPAASNPTENSSRQVEQTTVSRMLMVPPLPAGIVPVIYSFPPTIQAVAVTPNCIIRQNVAQSMKAGEAGASSQQPNKRPRRSEDVAVETPPESTSPSPPMSTSPPSPARSILPPLLVPPSSSTSSLARSITLPPGIENLSRLDILAYVATQFLEKNL